MVFSVSVAEGMNHSKTHLRFCTLKLDKTTVETTVSLCEAHGKTIIAVSKWKKVLEVPQRSIRVGACTQKL